MLIVDQILFILSQIESFLLKQRAVFGASKGFKIVILLLN